jgi:transposase-like protein
MFSYEDRIRAVKLYIKLGKRLGATIRQLGYPTKNSLIGWYREYEQGQDSQVGYTRSMSKYSDEQRQVPWHTEAALCQSGVVRNRHRSAKDVRRSHWPACCAK